MPNIFETRKFIKIERAWQRKYDPHAPKTGDFAPDFVLNDTIGENPIRLSDYIGKKPVGLVFGSFT